ncbi:hypothetical protein O6H91_04G014700 [Diphasiastrum complanatum]|uniref:Uncharacterized protein n=1 Tax=Diphasiastrum complanatum TaxID=34168 RepID=A0ACC2DUQ3_DIPCM|nr:hypothetical protein O6H91_04G014700 [Diphasiastrum complanatum]
MRSLIPLHLDLSPSALASEQWHLLRCSLPGQYLLKPMQVVSMPSKSRPENLKLYYFRDRHISNPRDIQNNCRCRRPMLAMDPTAFVQQRSDGPMPLQSCLWQIHSSTKEAYNDEFQTRSSGNEVRDEILKCYELVERLGRGAVYLGSARVEPDHAHFAQAIELGRELLPFRLFWFGLSCYGLMDAALKGALQAGKPVGGFKINNEGGKWMNSFRHPYLVAGTYLTCRFFSARKHGLVDAGVRSSLCDHTAFIALPGGIGTLDEAFEILTLIQLDRIGSKYPVPFLLMNYDGYYNHLISFLQTCEVRGTISDGEIDLLWRVCRNNSEALEYLADFYGINENERNFRETLQKI